NKNGFFNFDNPASLDTELMKQHISELRSNGVANVPIYDFTISERADIETVKAKELIIIDGLFAGSLLGEESDLDIYVDVELDLALLRRINRDMKERGRTLESVAVQYMQDVRPSYFKYIEPIKSAADIVIINNHEADQMIKQARAILKQLN
ncbi:MAG: hypothetical protein P8P98_00540, partial [Emcibacteraceae bacterium]|nr:hypothetical protein [Emcibacteraceae bacterium]